MHSRADAIGPVIDRFDEVLATTDAFDALLRIHDLRTIDWTMLADADLRRIKLEAASKIRRYAIVGAPTWMKVVVTTVGTVLPTKVRTFDSDEEAVAWRWLAEGEPVRTAA